MAVSDFESHALLPTGSSSVVNLQFTMKYNSDYDGHIRTNYYENSYSIRYVVNATTVYIKSGLGLWETGTGSGTIQRKSALDLPTTPFGSPAIWYTLSAADVTATGITSGVPFDIMVDLKYYGDSVWTTVIDETVTLTISGGSLSKPTTPTPANSATEVDFSGFELSWVNGGGATQYDVFIGVSGSLTLVSSGQAGTSYTTTLDELQLIYDATPINQIIYWRVDASDGSSTVTGDEWNFDARPAKVTTPSPANAAMGIRLFPTYGWTASTIADTYNLTITVS